MMTTRLTWHVTHPDRDIPELLQRIRPYDLEEVRLLYGGSERKTLENTLQNSQDVFTIRERKSRDMMAIIGVKPFGLLGSGASPWMLSCHGTERYRRELLVWSRRWIDQWRSEHKYLMNYVLREYTEALNWARHVGFRIGPAYRIGPCGGVFHRIEIGEL